MAQSYRIKLPMSGTNVPQLVKIEGAVTIGSAGAITALVPSGLGESGVVPADGTAVQGYLFTIVHSATGTYQVTPTESYIKVVKATAALTSQVAAGSANTLQVRVKPYDSTNNQLNILIVDTGSSNAATDPNSGDVLSFDIDFVNSLAPLV